MSDDSTPIAEPDDREVEAPPARTRLSVAWVSTVVLVIFGVALVDFIVQNTRHVRIEFFGVSGNIPVSVALLAAAIAGAIVVLAIGVGRVAQLRLTMRRQRTRRRDRSRAATPPRRLA